MTCKTESGSLSHQQLQPGFESYLNKWLNPNLGDLPLSSVNNAIVRGLVTKMTEAGLSPKMVNNVVQVVTRVVTSAVNEDGEQLYPSRLRKNRGCDSNFWADLSHSGVLKGLSLDFSCYRAPERGVLAPFRDTTAQTDYAGTVLRIRFRMRTRL